MPQDAACWNLLVLYDDAWLVRAVNRSPADLADHPG